MIRIKDPSRSSKARSSQLQAGVAQRIVREREGRLQRQDALELRDGAIMSAYCLFDNLEVTDPVLRTQFVGVDYPRWLTQLTLDGLDVSPTLIASARS